MDSIGVRVPRNIRLLLAKSPQLNSLNYNIVSLTRSNNGVKIRIENRGTGIENANMSSAITAGYRAAYTTVNILDRKINRNRKL